MNIYIVETKEKHLEDLLDLWNTPEVMKFVGFPNGLGYSMQQMQKWYEFLQSIPNTQHYCIFLEDVGFIGETFYCLRKDQEIASIDIKLHDKARGKQLAYEAVCFVLDQVFIQTNAQAVSVDPSIANEKALKLYERLGFQERNHPETDEFHRYMMIQRDFWKEKRRSQLCLKEITYDNFMDIIRLSVKAEQKGFVASNAYSLAQSKYQEECTPLAIYVDRNLVGFLMFSMDRDDKEYWIYRLMIDKHYQGMGYGKEAMKQIIARIQEDQTHHLLKISFEPENIAAQKLYESLGFQNTHEYDDDEIIYILKW